MEDDIKQSSFSLVATISERTQINATNKCNDSSWLGRHCILIVCLKLFWNNKHCAKQLSVTFINSFCRLLLGSRYSSSQFSCSYIKSQSCCAQNCLSTGYVISMWRRLPVWITHGSFPHWLFRAPNLILNVNMELDAPWKIISNNVNYCAWHVHKPLFSSSISICRLACSEISLSIKEKWKLRGHFFKWGFGIHQSKLCSSYQNS